MSDELTEKFPLDGGNEITESPEQRAARAIGLDSAQFAALPVTERYMLTLVTGLSDRLDRVVTGLSDRLDRVEAKIDERSRETRPLGERLDEILAKIVNLESNISEVKTELAEVKTELAEVKTELAEVKVEVGGLRGEVGGLRGEVGDLKDRVALVEESIKDLNREFLHMDVRWARRLLDLDDRILRLEADVGTDL